MVFQHFFGGGNDDDNSSKGSSKQSGNTGNNRVDAVATGAADESTPLVKTHERNNSAHAGDNFYFARSSSRNVPSEHNKFTTYAAVTAGGASDMTGGSSGAGLAPPGVIRGADIAPVQAMVDDDSDFEEPIPSRPVVPEAAGGSKAGVSFWQKIIVQKRAAEERKASKLEQMGAADNSRLMSKSTAAIKVEPKVFFSNERTFIAWLHASTTLAGGSLAIVAFTEGNETSQLYGLIMLPVAIIFLTYALYQYDHRSRMIRKREAGPYDDPQGAIVLSTLLMLSICATFGIKLFQILY